MAIDDQNQTTTPGAVVFPAADQPAIAPAADAATQAPATISLPTPEELAAMTKEDIAKLKTDLQHLAESAIGAMENAIVVKIQEEEAAAKAEIAKVEAEVVTWAQAFRDKHGISLQVAILGTALLLGILGRVIVL